ncbi:citrate synthase/methylcitrate synthase [Sutcliffiella horikoshii]|uniref:citrate synthase/methylcitrate synthase n=1 Tax=Sutcliffiella horikoshii TaxID=79883 RepID=UPI001CBCEFA8|nr:citrate synthase/methylcitrate synthase [Sutcliffiella horikoshii]UAL49401.1 citrate synthase/methylcitrate synthase [Sutcliffiella horikoshii]
MSIQRGLKGVIAAETRIAEVDGSNGRLIYRGYEIRDIATTYSFEEIAHLLWFGELPSGAQLEKFKSTFASYRNPSPTMEKVLNVLPSDMDMMSVVRTVISSAGGQSMTWKPTVEDAMILTAVIPTIIAYRKRILEGKDLIAPCFKYSHVENYLYMLHGSPASPEHIRALETYMILTMEHGMNASTFSARVTASTESDLVSAVTSAIGTMKGPLHGGAPSEVIVLLNELSEVENKKLHLREKILSGEKLMGFGHRVYKTHDPRSIALKETLSGHVGKDRWLDLALEVENAAIDVLEELKPGRGLYTNVEFYAAAIMKAINMDSSLFTPTFTASRMVGWTAHVLEQAEDNVIYRPLSRYVGK